MAELKLVDAVPVVHGRWIAVEASYENPVIDNICSECGEYACYDELPNYCPNCGAKMDLEDNNATS